ncbi:right-handed parallel beta-helix repeat-containing protein [Puniceicoccales bacterium CK1056]|uniref:Right-handed parallel beta-helix repeat-containing protein n=1 Tax=Oceanipulchritudo coccoides TaxID=2706888 RepID=A0A6B2M1W2_9BACT|nr:DNRLRE domain-containing protein [Oceanipulchritudo coccoides]NDV61720.1 right-handed parallel beta-helix repeat-containing protein [Oceanipulchritudo coccoides]
MHDPQSNFSAIISRPIWSRLAAIARSVGILAAFNFFSLSGFATGEHFNFSYLSEGPIQQEFYVSPDGRDSDSGTLDNPLQTLQAARDKASAYLASNLSSDGAVVVYLREGVYQQDSTIVFRPQHSGRANSPVIYAAFADETVVISGGKAITGIWEPVEGKPFYSITIPEAASGNWKFNSLYVNGESRTRARTPNYDEKMLRANGRVPRWSQELSLRFWEGDIDPTWSDLSNIDIVIPMTWTPVHHQIDVIDFDRRGVELASVGGQHQLYGDDYFRYYLSNVYEGLDVPGEWYLNPHTGVLYYYPYSGENLGEVSVVAPVVSSQLMSFEGNAVEDETISYIEFKGLEFRHTDTNREKWNGAYRQAHAFLDAAIYAEGLTHCIFNDCTFENLGEYAIELEVGSQDNVIFQCLFRDLGGGALQAGIFSLQDIQRARNSVGFVYEDVDTHPRTDVLRNRIENCIINKIGTYWTGVYAINIRFASYTQVLHNEIFDTHYSGVAIDARWTNFSGENYCHGNELAYNHVHHIGRGLHSDGGAFYQHGPTDNHYHHNVVHDLTKFPHRNEMKGIFLDAQSQGAIAEKNLIYDTEGAGLIQNWGLGNIFRNNIVSFTEGGAKRGKADPNDESAFNHLYLYSNVFISNDGVGLGQAWPPSQGEDIIRDNLFYDINQETLTFWGLSLEDWQAQSGLGQGTLIADPGVADPLQRDFTISTQNAALQQIGFQPFSGEVENAGVYGAESWTGLPQQLAANIRGKVPHWTESEIRALENRSDPDVIPEGTIHPEADASVRGGSASATNFGTLTSLQVAGTDGSSLTRQSYLRFDLSSIVQSFSKATLRLKLSSNRSEDAHNAHFVSDDSWEETGITWDNKPVLGEELDSDLIPENGEWLELDVTEKLRDELTGDQLFSVAVVSTGAGAASYRSREEEAPYVRPQLVIKASNPDAVLLARDCAPGESWETADVWSDGTAAGPGKDYLVDGFYSGPVLLRTPNAAGSVKFPGDSLALLADAALWITSASGGEVTIDNLVIDGGKLVASYPDSTVHLRGNIAIGPGGLIVEGTPGTLAIESEVSGDGPITQQGPDRDTSFNAGTWGGDLSIEGGVLRFGYGVVSGQDLSIDNAVFDLNAKDHIFASLTINGVVYAPGTYTAEQLGESVSGSGTLTIRDTTVRLLKSMPFSVSWDAGSYWSDGKPAHADGDYIVDGSVAFMLRTPHNMGNAAFPGRSLTLMNGGGIWIKSSSFGEVTFPNLIVDGGRIVSSYDDSTVTFKGFIDILPGGMRFEGNPGPLIVEAMIAGSGPITQIGPGRDTTLTNGSWAGDLDLREGTLRFAFDVRAGKRFNYGGGIFDLNGRNHVFESLIINGSTWENGIYTSDQLGSGFTGNGTIEVYDPSNARLWGPYTVDSNGYVDTQSWLGWLYIDNSGWVYSVTLGKWIWMAEPVSMANGAWAYFPR